MKKLLALLLALVMILSLAACGEKAETEEEETKPSATEAKGDETKPEKEPAEKPEKTEPEKTEPEETEPEETKPSKKDSDFENGMELLEEYAEVLEDVLALVVAEGVDAEDAELEAQIEEYETAIADVLTNGDLTDDEYETLETTYTEMIEAFYEALEEAAENAGSTEVEEETDYELTMRLLEEYAYVLEEVIALYEEEGEDASDAELEAAVAEYESALAELFANGDMTEEEAEETQEIYLAMIEAFYEAVA